MARVTVEDCLDKVDNRFHLVLLASKRARHIARHPEDALVAWENDKPTVVALREIADGLISRTYTPPKTERRSLEQMHALPALNDDDLDD